MRNDKIFTAVMNLPAILRHGLKEAETLTCDLNNSKITFYEGSSGQKLYVRPS